MKKNVYNPFLPQGEYIPDGEPHVFGDRVYLYGSHDRARGWVYCQNDYVCYSAPVDDLSDWRYEGVIYKTDDDPMNQREDANGNLYAPDVTQGADGRYYLYYCLSDRSCVGVAVSDTPGGKYSFYGNVQYEDGTLLGMAEDDDHQFDPAVLLEDGKVYLYTGFCSPNMEERPGAMCTVLADDMLTIIEKPKYVLPSKTHAKGTGFEQNAYFEAPSIRKVDNEYYLIYSSVQMYELCYARSHDPRGPFTYGGVIISNNDLGISHDKPADLPRYFGGNNHGGIEEINGQWYIFYHRHTHGTNYSRQAMAEKIEILDNGDIPQVEMSSCGLNGGPLEAKGTFPASICSALFTDVPNEYTGGMGRNGYWLDASYPIIIQDEMDGEDARQYIFNMTNSSTAGYKYFNFKNVEEVSLVYRAYCNGVFEFMTDPEGPVLGTVEVSSMNRWAKTSCKINLPEGVHPFYIRYKGTGAPTLLEFSFA